MPPRTSILIIVAAVVEVDLAAESSDTQAVEAGPAPVEAEALASGDDLPPTVRSRQAPPLTLRDLVGLPAREVRDA
jgi:hypothetical protein